MEITKLSVFSLLILCFVCHQVLASADECEAWIDSETTPEDTTTDITTTENIIWETTWEEAPLKSFRSKRDVGDDPRSDQKSLLIIFDSTGSMGSDLAQLRQAAKDIVNFFAERDDKPIYNYILSVFNDPSNFFCIVIGLLNNSFTMSFSRGTSIDNNRLQ